MVQKKEDSTELRFSCTRYGNCCLDKNRFVNFESLGYREHMNRFKNMEFSVDVQEEPFTAAFNFFKKN
jgi:hypothetical protein